MEIRGSLPRPVQIRSNKYLNNVVDLDHRRVKQRTDRCWVSSDSIRRASRSAASNWRKRSKRLSSRRENWRVDLPHRQQSGRLFWRTISLGTTFSLRGFKHEKFAPEP